MAPARRYDASEKRAAAPARCGESGELGPCRQGNLGGVRRRGSPWPCTCRTLRWRETTRGTAKQGRLAASDLSRTLATAARTQDEALELGARAPTPRAATFPSMPSSARAEVRPCSSWQQAEGRPHGGWRRAEARPQGAQRPTRMQPRKDVDRTSKCSYAEDAVLRAVLEVKRRGGEESMGRCGPIVLEGQRPP